MAQGLSLTGHGDNGINRWGMHTALGIASVGKQKESGQWEMTCTEIPYGKSRLSLTHTSGCEVQACPKLPLPKEKGNEDLKGGMM